MTSAAGHELKIEGDRLVLSSSAMAAADRRTIEEFGLPSFTLMEVASHGVCRAIEESLGGPRGLEGSRVLVLAGRGNNGGDGLAVARLLVGRGARVWAVVLSGTAEGSPETRTNLKLLQQLAESERDRVSVHIFDETATADAELGKVLRKLPTRPFDVVVDALLGVGSKGPLREPVATLMAAISMGSLRVAVDVPTGLDSDTGETSREAVSFDLTVSIGALKPGQLTGRGPELCGRVVCVDIGLPPHVRRSALTAPGCGRVAGRRTVRAWLGGAVRAEHKFAAGQAAIVAGSNRYTGALVLAARAAAASGAGYVVCASTERAAQALDAQVPEVVALSFQATGRGTLPSTAARAILEETDKARAYLVGPGLGGQRSPEAFECVGQLVTDLLVGADRPMVLDAHGISALGFEGAIAALLKRRAPTVLTPHVKEFERMVAALRAARGEGPEGEELPMEAPGPTWLASEWAQRLGVVIVLKGSPTVVASPNGETWVAPLTHRALATAGSGDVLAGTITGLLAQGLDPVGASVAAVHLGLGCAVRWSKKKAPAAASASDLIAQLPAVLAAMKKAPTCASS